jgi:hypothetical protein
MVYLCLLEGVIEYSSTNYNDFLHYQSVYQEDHEGQPVQYLTLTDEEYDQFFSVKDEEYYDD